MRRGFGIFGAVMTLLVIAVVGFFAYQIGWSDGLAQHVPDGTTAVAPYPYYYGFGGFGPGHWVFGLFGLLFGLFFLFFFLRILAFGLFGWRRGWGGWGYGGGGWGRHGYYGGGQVPPAIDERMKEWHRQAHGQAPASAPSTPPPPPTVPDK